MRYSFLSSVTIKFSYIAIAAFFLGQACFLQAAPMFYTFDGVAEDFSSVTGLVSPEDFGVVLNKTKVSYIFEVDFDRDVSTQTNSAATWDYFYSDLVLGEALIQGERPDSTYGYNAYFNRGLRTSAINGSGGVRIRAFFRDVEYWSVGQQFRFEDSGFFSTDDIGAVYLFGDVELTSISSTFSHSVPEPSTLLLFSSVLGMLGLGRLRKKQDEINGS